MLDATPSAENRVPLSDQLADEFSILFHSFDLAFCERISEDPAVLSFELRDQVQQYVDLRRIAVECFERLSYCKTGIKALTGSLRGSSSDAKTNTESDLFILSRPGLTGQLVIAQLTPRGTMVLQPDGDIPMRDLPHHAYPSARHRFDRRKLLKACVPSGREGYLKLSRPVEIHSPFAAALCCARTRTDLGQWRDTFGNVLPMIEPARQEVQSASWVRRNYPGAYWSKGYKFTHMGKSYLIRHRHKAASLKSENAVARFSITESMLKGLADGDSVIFFHDGIALSVAAKDLRPSLFISRIRHFELLEGEMSGEFQLAWEGDPLARQTVLNVSRLDLPAPL